MAVLERFVLFLSVLAFGNAIYEEGFQLSTNMETIESSAVPLNVTCYLDFDSYQSDRPEVAAILSMKISRSTLLSQNVQDLASISVFGGLHIYDTYNGTANGSITERGGITILTLIMENPGKGQEGEYICEPHLADFDGAQVDVWPPIESVEYIENSAAHVLERVEELQADLDECLAQFPKAPPTSTPLNTTVSPIEDAAVILVLQELIAKLSGVIALGDQRIASSSEVYNSEGLYFVLESHLDYREASQLCQGRNGHVVEVNTEGEFAFLADFLLTQSNTPCFMTAVAYNGNDFVSRANPDASLYIDLSGDGLAPEMNEELLLCADNSDVFYLADGKGTNDAYVCEISV